MDHDVIVIGAGLAGLQAAVRLTEQGRDVLLIEREQTVGGRERTDDVDGFQLDRGFHVLNPAYPAVRRHVDVDALDLHQFGAGIQVRRTWGLATLSHPLRHPAGIMDSLRSGLLSPLSIAALARWAGPVLAAPRRVIDGRDRPLRDGLKRSGIRGPIRDEVLEPFLAGVLATDELDTSDAFVRLLVRMFALGLPGLPARGIRALPEQLHQRAERTGRLTTTLGTSVERVESTAVDVGRTITARAVLVAVGPEALDALVDAPRPATHGLVTWWFAADTAPTDCTMLAVDGRRAGPVVNTAVVSNAVPSYAPPGRHLIQATCLLSPTHQPAEADVRRQTGEICGVDATRWELLARHDIPHALPAQPAPLRTTSEARLPSNIYLAGDHRDTASIQGALVSGTRVADQIARDLGQLLG